MLKNVMQVFATPVYYKQFPNMQELNETLVSTIRKLEAENESHDINRAHRGGYYSDGTFFDMNLPGVREVQKLFGNALEDYLRELEVLHTVKKIHLQGWVALTRAQDYQTPHVHAGSTVSGIYYAQMADLEEPEGCIDLITPIDAQEMTFLKGHSRSYCRILPKAGIMTLFPSYLRHYTHPFESDEERICIVCNAFVTQG